MRRLSCFGEADSPRAMRELDRKTPSPSSRRRSRRIMYSSGEDSWEEERRNVRRSEKLTVPGSRSRSNSHSMSPRRYPDYDYGGQQRSPRPERLRSSRRRTPSPSISKTPILDKFGLSVKEEMEKMRYKSRHGSSSSRKSPRREKLSEDICYISPRRSPRREKESLRYREEPRREKESPRYREEPRREKESLRYREEPRREKESPRYRSPRRESASYREGPRHDYRYYETQTESSEDWRDRRRKPSGKYEHVIDLEQKMVSVSSIKKESKTSRGDDVDHDYVNYSPTKGPKVDDLEESMSPWGEKSPRDRISAMEDVEDTESTERIIDEEKKEESLESPDFTYNIQDIMVQPAETSTIPEIKETINSPILINEDSNKFLTLKEDEKDSCLGLSFSDLNSEHELIKKDDFVLSVSPPAPKQWTLFSFSADGQFQVRDEETGEIFYIYNQQPEPETTEDNDEEEKGEDEEEISWCSIYLCSKIFGLLLMMGGLAAMVVVAIQ